MDQPVFEKKQLDKVPQALKDLRAWSVTGLSGWDGKRFKDKYIYIATSGGRRASCDKPNDWREWEEALAHCGATELPTLARCENLILIDLDECFADGKLQSWAQEIVKRLPTYTEISSSGRGLHLFLYADGFERRNHKFPAALYSDGATGDIEIFCKHHFVTVTGNHLQGTPDDVATLPRALELIAALEEKKQPKPSATPVPAEKHELSETEQHSLIGKALQNPKIADLWNSGGTDGSSEGDLALANHLCRYCGGDPDLIESLMRQSQRLRSKWDTKRGDQTWIQSTIGKAISGWDGTTCFDAQALGSRKKFVSGDEVLTTAADTEWLWQDYIPNDYLSMIVGPFEEGKSFLAVAVALAVTGQVPNLPNGAPYEGETGSVLFVDYESGEAMTCSRLTNAGFAAAPMLFLSEPPPLTKRNRTSGFAIVDDVVEAISTIPDLQWVVIDSLSGGSMDGDEKISKIAAPLQALARACQQTGLPITVIHHVNKTAFKEDGSTQVSKASVRGSSAIMQFARSVIAIDRPIEDCDIRRVQVLKSNLLAMKPAEFGFHIADGRIVACDPPMTKEHKTKVEQCEQWLLTVLANGPVKSSDLNQQAQEYGFSAKVLRLAGKRLGLISRAARIDDRISHWTTELPFDQANRAD